MQLCISSIAWRNDEEEAVAQKMQELGVAHVELAPTKIWTEPVDVSEEEAKKVVTWWKDRNIEVVAFQSMLFSHPELHLFDDEANTKKTLAYLQKFIRLAGFMGAKRMVFGSPKNRQIGTLTYEQAFKSAVTFFSELAKTAEEVGVVFCIEPNAPQYNCDFVTTAQQGIDVVSAVNRGGFKLHLDAACMSLAGDLPENAIINAQDYLRHFHISSPMLDTVEQRDDVDHKAAAAALSTINYSGFVSIEMRPTEDDNVARVEKSIRFAKSVYFG